MRYGKVRQVFPSLLVSILNSYSLVFFSNNRAFALILVAVTFFDPAAGLSGLIAVLASNLLAYLIGFNRASIKAGYYGFNSLLVGLGLGIFYQPGVAYFALLLFAALLTLFLTVAMEGVIGKYGLPFLSLSFLIAIWVVSLASRQFSSLEVSGRGIYMMNEMYAIGKLPMVRAYDWFYTIRIPDPMRLYFRSLGAIFFQYYLLPGILVAVGLLIYSRIAFVLSILGFAAAYCYYLFIGADMRELSAGYIGFNFILTSIAIGGFFTIPSKYSFLWVLLLTPLISVLLTSSNVFFNQFQLSVFSLPFNIIVLLFLYVMKFRERYYTRPELVAYQQFSPEKNLYARLNYGDRFGNATWFPLSLPFIGKWKVTQGHEGEQTHQGEWRHAWDFETTDDEGKNFTGTGTRPEDYYSYSQPVIAPADGTVEEMEDDVEDNIPGEVNLGQNWGNTIVIRHSPQLFTKICHLKKGSIGVAKGDTVKKGDLLAMSGNSGRSPVPHIHFQVQSTPYIGSKTIDHPLSHYVLYDKGRPDLRSFERPRRDDLVCDPGRHEVLEKAFRFIPGQEFLIHSAEEAGRPVLKWEVRSDALNSTFIFCERSGSKAWFRYDGTVHYFTHFEGNKRSLLFHFYLAGFKVLTAFYKDLVVNDSYPLSLLNSKTLIFLQDFVAPFFLFLRSDYSLRYVRLEEDILHPVITLEAVTTVRIWKRAVRRISYAFTAGTKGITVFSVTEKNSTHKYIFQRADEIRQPS
jgi:urea transporter/murein DD-endopeptidase MepM/ murein hydrolase activator NlpD